MDKSNTQEKRQPVQSATLKLGKRTFFFDVNLASNNKKYLKITESRFIDEQQGTKRSSFVLFQEDVPNFQNSLNEIVGFLA